MANYLTFCCLLKRRWEWKKSSIKLYPRIKISSLILLCDGIMHFLRSFVFAWDVNETGPNCTGISTKKKEEEEKKQKANGQRDGEMKKKSSRWNWNCTLYIVPHITSATRTTDLVSQAYNMQYSNSNRHQISYMWFVEWQISPNDKRECPIHFLPYKTIFSIFRMFGSFFVVKCMMPCMHRAAHPN